MAIKGKIALIIDDDPSVRALACKVVEGIGFEVMEASGVIEALRMIKERVPHLILLDLNMPEVKGVSFLKMAQQNSKLHYIPVVVFSTESRN
ncbi:MAG: response regulator, partial [Bacteriovoracaceae bacterium]|nr:response regulator [Bacteriovoracaceae bacterium]